MLNRNILVSFNGTETAINAAKRAYELATHEKSYLTLLYVHRPYQTYEQHGAWVPADSSEYLADLEERVTNGVVARFVQTRELLGLRERMFFSLERGHTETELGRRAPYFDMICLGKHRRRQEEELPPTNPATLALAAERPVLQIPDDMDKMPQMTNVAVLWRGTQSCARALESALELAPNTQNVTLLMHGSEIKREAFGAIRRHLKTHEIKAKRKTMASIRSLEENLLISAQDDAPHLLALGVQSQNQFTREFFEDFPGMLLLTH